jgi:hypothetical protein
MSGKRRRASRKPSPPLRPVARARPVPQPATPEVAQRVATPTLPCRTDLLHLALLLGAVALAYLLPFELLLLSYAILGPAHYLTEISWLHDRNYFLSAKPIAVLLALAAVVAVRAPDAWASGFSLWLGFAVAALAIGGIGWVQRGVLLAILAAITAAMAGGNDFVAVTAVLLPTLIHVSVFTLVFMTLGAWRSGRWSQMTLVLAYLAAIALILVLPPNAGSRSPVLAQLGHHYFGSVAPALGQVLHLSNFKFDARLTGLLSFVYTYHYLNWFIKADVIGWRRIPPMRLAAIVATSATATGIYFYDYTTGFAVLLALSMIHVVLEFPLNTLSIRQLAGVAAQGVPRQPRVAS